MPAPRRETGSGAAVDAALLRELRLCERPHPSMALHLLDFRPPQQPRWQKDQHDSKDRERRHVFVRAVDVGRPRTPR